MGHVGPEADDPTYVWGGQLKYIPSLMDAFAGQVDKLAAEAAERFPYAGAVLEEIQAVADEIRGVQAESETWHTTWRATNSEIIQRVEDPRGSVDKEITADSAEARRDT